VKRRITITIIYRIILLDINDISYIIYDIASTNVNPEPYGGVRDGVSCSAPDSSDSLKTA
jgi:hypothetical protein